MTERGGVPPPPTWQNADLDRMLAAALQLHRRGDAAATQRAAAAAAQLWRIRVLDDDDG